MAGVINKHSYYFGVTHQLQQTESFKKY